MMFRMVMILVTLVIGGGCAASQPCPAPQQAPAKVSQEPVERGVLLERYADEVPAWKNTLYAHVFDKTAGMHYFFGYATSKDKDESRTKAYSNALSNISKQIFVRVRYGTDNYTEQVLGHEASVVKDVTIERGAEITLRDYEHSLYTEKWRRDGMSVYDSWCRIEIPVAVYEELIKEAQENERGRKEQPAP